VHDEPPTSSTRVLPESGDDLPIRPSASSTPQPPRQVSHPVRDGILAGLGLFTLVSATLAYFFLMAGRALVEENRASLARTAALAASFLDGDAVDSVIRDGRDGTPVWERAVAPLRQVLRMTGDVRYAYVMRLDGDSIRFVLDASPKGDHDHDGVEDYSPVGSAYLWGAPELYRALREGSREVDLRLIRDPWGLFLSAYAPIRDSRGRLLGVVGVDLDATDWVAGQARLREALLLCLVLTALSSLLAGIGIWAYRRRSKADRARELAEEARQRMQSLQFAKELESKIEARTRDLRHANQELQKALRIREAFLATANHELRTPLQSLLTSVELLGQGMLGPLNAAQERRVGTIGRCGRHLLDLITQVLDLSRARSGKVELFKERVDLQAVCEETLEILADEARSGEVALNLRISAPARWIEADSLRLRQILLNLLGNALKFTPPGGTIELETQSLADGRTVLLTITDTGPGIPEQARADLFRSLDDVAILSGPNQKLGLPLAAWLASLHGGSLRHEPVITGGSRFLLRLPAGPPARNPAESESDPPSGHSEGPAQSGGSLRVLIAEDNLDIRETLCEFLEAKGCTVQVASNGLEAVAQAESMRPDLVLMDVQMPVMDGLAATRALRAIPSLADLPIVIMTAFASGEDAERCREAGATSYVPKPIELRRLGRILSEYAGLPSSGGDAG